MHFNLRRVVAVLSLPLLGSAFVVVAAEAASAATWQDTALQAFNVSAVSKTTGAVVNGVVSAGGSKLTFTAPAGEQFAASPAPKFTQGTPTTDASLTTSNVHQLVLTTSNFSTGKGTLTFTIASTTSNVTAAETVSVTETTGVLAQSSATSVPGEKVAVSVFNNNATGAVRFTGTVTQTPTASYGVRISQSNLPTGLVSGNPLVPGSAVPRIYTGVVYTATDPLGSTFSGTFSLHVFGHVVVPQQLAAHGQALTLLTAPASAAHAVLDLAQLDHVTGDETLPGCRGHGYGHMHRARSASVF